EQPYRYASVGQPPEGPVAAAAAFQDSRFVLKTSRSGDSMARVLDIDRLLSALKPELIRRLEASRTSFRGSIEFVTDMGEATLALTEGDDTLTVHLPQTALARLALGAYDPADLLNRFDTPPDERTRALLQVLFPQRHPHMSLPDRY
ncbi:MAG TPA: hypothetical protein VGW38_20980, partial [Chloroflexota bacterium]|nr:hypothetical protein [Chloroflexota bacterium]